MRGFLVVLSLLIILLSGCSAKRHIEAVQDSSPLTISDIGTLYSMSGIFNMYSGLYDYSVETIASLNADWNFVRCEKEMSAVEAKLIALRERALQVEVTRSTYEAYQALNSAIDYRIKYINAMKKVCYAKNETERKKEWKLATEMDKLSKIYYKSYTDKIGRLREILIKLM
jgi:hypothetical protein